jgi:hypothetical protein
VATYPTYLTHLPTYSIYVPDHLRSSGSDSEEIGYRDRIMARKIRTCERDATNCLILLFRTVLQPQPEAPGFKEDAKPHLPITAYNSHPFQSRQEGLVKSPEEPILYPELHPAVFRLFDTTEGL